MTTPLPTQQPTLNSTNQNERDNNKNERPIRKRAVKQAKQTSKEIKQNSSTTGSEKRTSDGVRSTSNEEERKSEDYSLEDEGRKYTIQDAKDHLRAISALDIDNISYVDGSESLVPFREIPKRCNPNIPIDLFGRKLSSLAVNNILGAEATKALQEYYGVLGKKLYFNQREKHPHGLGSFLRSHFENLIIYRELSGAMNWPILELGSTLQRIRTKRDVDGTLLYERVHALTPQNTVRQLIRARNLALNPVEHDYCTHGYNVVLQKPECKCGDLGRIAIAIDTIVEDGVLEALAYNSIRNNKPVFATFSDISYAIKKTGICGRYADDEGTYQVDVERGTVQVNLNGNPPYVNNILNTDGNYWQQHLYMNQEGTNVKLEVLCVFEVIETIMNGDVPYRLVRMNAFTADVRKDLLEFSMPGLMTFEDRWDNCGRIAPNEVDTTLAEENKIVDLKNVVPERQIRDWGNPRIAMPYNGIESYTEEENTIQIIELGLSAKQLVGGMSLEFTSRKEIKEECEFIETVRLLFTDSNRERFHVTRKIDHKSKHIDHYLNLTQYDSKWVFFDDRRTFSAPIALVDLAFKRIGVKKSIDALAYATSSMTKELEDILAEGKITLGDRLSTRLAVSEAVIIARVLISQQTERMATALSYSVSANPTLKR